MARQQQGTARSDLTDSANSIRSSGITTVSSAPRIPDNPGQLARVGYWERNEVENRCTYCSADLAHISGVSVDEYKRLSNLGRGNTAWIHSEDRARYKREFERNKKNGSGFQIEYRLLRTDGTIVDVAETVEPFFDASGVHVRSIGFVRDITDARRSNAALQRITGLYEQTEALAKIGHWEWDEEIDRLSYCSEELARLCGMTIDEYRASASSTFSDADWTHPEDRDRYIDAIDQYCAAPEQYEIQYRMLTADGNVRQVREVTAPIFDNEGSLVRSIGYIQDISDAKRVEEWQSRTRDELERKVKERTEALQVANRELLESEQRLKDAARIAKLGYFKWDVLTGRGIYCDEQLAKILGSPKSECMTETIGHFLQRVHINDRDMVRSIYRAGYAKKESVQLDYRIVRPDGEIRYVREVAQARTDASGKVVETFGTLQDITERKAIHDQLLQREQQLSEVGANSKEVFWILSDDWRKISYISPSYEEVFGRSCESLIADPLTWIENVHPDDREMVIVQMRDKITGLDTTPEFSYYRIVRPDSEIRWLQARAYPIRDENDKVIRFTGFVEDITERKESEEALHQAQKMDAVGKLTGGVAHDFNNLLAVILGNARLLEGELSEDSRALLNEIILAGNRGAQLTRRLLAFSRQQPLQPAETDVNELVAGMVELLRRTLGATIVVHTSLANSVPQALVDPNLLENAILNVALNARDAMPDGGTLTIQTQLIAAADKLTSGNPDIHANCDQVRIVLKDDGTGMASDVLARASEPFFTTKDIGQGSGLGLSMVYGFAKQSNGDLLVESDVGEGTTVAITLPGVAAVNPECRSDSVSG